MEPMINSSCMNYDGDDDCKKCTVNGYIFSCPNPCKDYVGFFSGAKQDSEIALCLGYDPPNTNFDRINAMSIEELAAWIKVRRVGFDINKEEVEDQYMRGYFDGKMHKPPVITNADRIRAMSDEELAAWLEDRTMLPINGLWLDWLKQEASND